MEKEGGINTIGMIGKVETIVICISLHPVDGVTVVRAVGVAALRPRYQWVLSV